MLRTAHSAILADLQRCYGVENGAKTGSECSARATEEMPSAHPITMGELHADRVAEKLVSTT